MQNNNNHLPGHPYCLIKDGIVTHVIYAQGHDNLIVKDALSKFSFDKSLNVCELNEEVYIGQYEYEPNKFRHASPYFSWVWNSELDIWEAPIPYPQDNNLYNWDEINQEWVWCANCNEANS
jgi:hypothetical protein